MRKGDYVVTKFGTGIVTKIRYSLLEGRDEVAVRLDGDGKTSFFFTNDVNVLTRVGQGEKRSGAAFMLNSTPESDARFNPEGF